MHGLKTVGLVLIPSEGSHVGCFISATTWGMDSWNFCHNAYNRHNSIWHKLSLKYYIIRLYIDMILNHGCIVKVLCHTR